MNELLRAHCEKYKFVTVNCFKWKQFFISHFQAKGEAETQLLQQIDWSTWFHAPGLPPNPGFDTSLADESHALAQALVSDPSSVSPEQDISSWSSARTVALLEKLLNLQATEAKEKNGTDFRGILTQMASRFPSLSESKNAEIRFRWLTANVRAGLASFYPDAVAFLTEQGRMKFIRPLYRDLFKGDAQAKQLALSTFEEYKSMYHAIARTMVAKDLGVYVETAAQ